MAEKRVNGRIVNKHATEAEWKANASFVPFKGEAIIYDIDDNYNFERMKIGDGTTTVEELPFVGTSLQVGTTQPTFPCTWFKVTG